MNPTQMIVNWKEEELFSESKKCEKWRIGTADGHERLLGYPSIGPGVVITHKPRPKMPSHLTEDKIDELKTPTSAISVAERLAAASENGAEGMEVSERERGQRRGHREETQDCPHPQWRHFYHHLHTGSTQDHGEGKTPEAAKGTHSPTPFTHTKEHT